MGMFRKVHTAFWKDEKVSENLSPQEKLFFIYLLTNPSTTQCGIYKITKRQIAFDIGYSLEEIENLIKVMQQRYDLIKYNETTCEIAIKNWGKYNFTRSGKPMIDCIISELETIKDKSLIAFVRENIRKEEIKEIYKYQGLETSYKFSSQDKDKDKEKEKEKDKDNMPTKKQLEEINKMLRVI